MQKLNFSVAQPPTLPDGDGSNQDPSWVVKQGCVLIGAQPICSKPADTCDQCQALCDQNQQGPPPNCCQSVNYNPDSKMCCLYNVRLDDSSPDNGGGSSNMLRLRPSKNAMYML